MEEHVRAWEKMMDDVHLSNGMQFTQQLGPTNGSIVIKEEWYQHFSWRSELFFFSTQIS